MLRYLGQSSLRDVFGAGAVSLQELVNCQVTAADPDYDGLALDLHDHALAVVFVDTF